MPRYFKAYTLGELRAFTRWHEAREELLRPKSGEPVPDDTVVYLGEDLIVHRDCLEAGEPVWEEGSEEWTRFCRERLGFAVPDWLAEPSAKLDPQDE